MKIKLTHFAILIGGVLIVFFLSLLPKFVVSDEEKKIKASEEQVRQEIVSETSQHEQSEYDAELANKIRKQIASAEISKKYLLIDSLGVIYKNAFMLDSAMNLYFQNAHLDKKYYIMSVRDGLTGFQMTQNPDKKRYYQSLCDKVINVGLEKHPDYLDLKVEQLRFNTLSAAFNGQAPMQWVGELKSLVDKNPSLVSGQLALAEFYATVNKKDEAISRYLQVVKVDKENLQAHIELVNLYLEAGKNISAKEHALRLQELNKHTKDSFIESFVAESLKKLEH